MKSVENPRLRLAASLPSWKDGTFGGRCLRRRAHAAWPIGHKSAYASVIAGVPTAELVLPLSTLANFVILVLLQTRVGTGSAGAAVLSLHPCKMVLLLVWLCAAWDCLTGRTSNPIAKVYATNNLCEREKQAAGQRPRLLPVL